VSISSRTKTIAVRSAAVLAAGLMAVGAVAGPASAAAATHLTNIRWGVHPGFDRVVLDFDGHRPAFGVTTLTELTQCASGKPISLPGDEFIELRVDAAAHNDNGQVTFPGPWKKVLSMPYVTGYAVTCDFEGVLSVAVGVRGSHDVTTFPLTSPSRIVLDVEQ
jgi:hypothetical protein